MDKRWGIPKSFSTITRVSEGESCRFGVDDFFCLDVMTGNAGTKNEVNN